MIDVTVRVIITTCTYRANEGMDGFIIHIHVYIVIYNLSTYIQFYTLICHCVMNKNYRYHFMGKPPPPFKNPKYKRIEITNY